MNHSRTTDSDAPHAARDKRRVAFWSVLAAVALTLVKLTVGLATNSLGILSEALHSALDLMAALITLWAVQVSAKPADPDHTYGHGKFENLSALFETLLLLVTCIWIINEAISRLFFQEQVKVDASIWAFLVVIGSIIVDYGRSTALRRAAQKYQSQALEADALHFSTDIWSSCVVLLGLAGVLAGKHFNNPHLHKADSIAALGVAAIVIWVSLKLGKKSVDDLLDAIPKDLQAKVTSVLIKVPGVEAVRQVRVRRSGPEVFADVTLTVWHQEPIAQAHQIADQAEEAVRSVVPGVDIVVHVEPGDAMKAAREKAASKP